MSIAESFLPLPERRPLAALSRCNFLTTHTLTHPRSPAQRAALLEHGLHDRVDSVKRAAVALLTRWLDQCEGQPLRLLRALGPADNEALCCDALRALIGAGQVAPTKVARQEGGPAAPLRAVFEAGELLQDEAALFW